MEHNNPIRYPIGDSSFKSIRNDGAVYIDKTDLVYQLVKGGKYYFLSRPRRFGKSLLVSTLEAYFRGKRELFEGLAIGGLEKEWTEYPVLHFDFSLNDYSGIATPEPTPEQEGNQQKKTTLQTQLDMMLGGWEETYGRNEKATDFAQRFQSVIERAHAQTGRPVVILIDEYDKPILDAEGNPSLQEQNQAHLRSFYGVLKGMVPYLRFVFITGITKFVHVNIFSGLNNLEDISLADDYAAICGITERELRENLAVGAARLAEQKGYTLEETYAQLKAMYDGYHFSPDAEEGIYNPFSLLQALKQRRLDNFWVDTGTPQHLFRAVADRRVAQKQIGQWRMSRGELSRAGAKGVSAKEVSLAALLYQAGYLTIESFSGGPLGVYTLCFPNGEVQAAFYDGLLSVMFRTEASLSLEDFVAQLGQGEVEEFLNGFHALLARGDYRVAGDAEIYFQNVMLMFCVLLGLVARAEHATSNGRIDLVVELGEYIYLFEFKLDRPAAEAIQQIEEKEYAAPYAADRREVVKLGVSFSSQTRNIAECIVRRQGREDAVISY